MYRNSKSTEAFYSPWLHFHTFVNSKIFATFCSKPRFVFIRSNASSILSSIRVPNFVLFRLHSRKFVLPVDLKLALLSKTVRTLQPYQNSFLLYFLLSHILIQILLHPEVYYLKIRRLPNQQNTQLVFLYCSSTSCVRLPLRKPTGSCENGSRAGCERTLFGCRALKPTHTFMSPWSLFWLSKDI